MESSIDSIDAGVFQVQPNTTVRTHDQGNITCGMAVQDYVPLVEKSLQMWIDTGDVLTGARAAPFVLSTRPANRALVSGANAAVDLGVGAGTPLPGQDGA